MGEALRTSGQPRVQTVARKAEDFVLIGTDGHCYMLADSNRTQDQHLGKSRISADRVAQWRAILGRRYGHFFRRSIRYLFVLGPDKQSVHWSKLCPGTKGHRNSLVVCEGALPEGAFIDPIPALIEAEKTGIIYGLTDNHWDMRGGYVAYREIVGRMPAHAANSLREGVDFEYLLRDTAGDMGNKFTPARKAPAHRMRPKTLTARRIYANGVERNGSVQVYRKAGLTNIGVVCGDSGTQAFTPYLAEHFGLLIQIRGSTDLSFISSLRPEIVIGELGERFFIAPPVSCDDSPVEMFFIRRLTRGEITAESYARLRFGPDCEALPLPLRALIRRNDALGDMLTADAPTKRQRFYMGPAFAGATSGDVLTACYLAWAWEAPLDDSWAKALAVLPAAVQEEFRNLCPV